MAAWLFQGNPDTFDVDRYFADHDTVTWAVRQESLASEMHEGDRVYFWRAAGRDKHPSGVVAAGKLVGEPERRPDDPDSVDYWHDRSDALANRLRVTVELDGGGEPRLLGKEALLADSVLSELRIFKMRNETNYRLTPGEAERLEGLWRDAPVEPPTAWLLIALDDEERQHAGNVGYEDDVERVYRFDSMVPNSRQIREGDLAVLRSSELLGLARIARLESAPGTKELRRCPECGKTSLKPRKTLTPRYRCDSCNATFDEPRIEEAEVTKYEAHFDGSFVGAPNAVTLADLRAACPKYNGQHAMQRIDLGAFVSPLGQVDPRVASLISARSFGSGRAGIDKALSTAAQRATAAGDFDPHNLEEAIEKVSRAVTQRRGQPQFREELLAAYGGRCAITGCDAKEALEAAHIVPYKGRDTNHVQNGLLLRADIHTLFDLGLIAIDTERWTVIVHPTLRDGHYAALHGTGLHRPGDTRLHPSRDALDNARRQARL